MRAYEQTTETYEEAAARFAVQVTTPVLWVQQHRHAGSVSPNDRAWGLAVVILNNLTAGKARPVRAD